MRAYAAFFPLAAVLVATQASGQDAATVAAQRYDAGSKAFSDHRFVEAALFFEAATVERASAAALYTAALAWEQANAPDRAADDYMRALATSGLDAPSQQAAQAKLAALEPVLGRLSVTAPDGWFIQVDGNSEVAAPATLHATPGMHSLCVRAQNRPLERRPVHLAMGEETKIELKDTPLPPEGKAPPAASNVEREPAPPAAPAGPHESTGVAVRKTVGLVTIGFGVSTLAAGMVLGFQALDAKDAYNAHPTQAAFDHASSLQNWTNIAFIAGGVLTVGGAALVFWPFGKKSEASVEAAPTVGGMLLRGRF